MRRVPFGLLLVVALVVGCKDEGSTPESAHAPPPASDSEATEDADDRGPERARAEPGHPRHTEDGGWAPSEDLLRRAAAMTDEEVAAEVDALADAERVRILRAGLRLADGPAAVACASRLEWGQVDGWESARIVELVRAPYVLCEADTDVFHHLREILGSDDIPGFLRELPPLPWRHSPNVLGHLHRMDREEHLPVVVEVASSAAPEIADPLLGNLGVASGYCDDHREAIVELWLGDEPIHPDDLDPPPGGLPRELRRWLRWEVLDRPTDDPFRELEPYIGRWLRDCPPADDGSPEDLGFRIEVTRRARGHSMDWSTELMLLQLGRLSDRRSESLLRELIDESSDDVAELALARRGDRRALANATEWAADAGDEDLAALAVAVLWEVRPDAVVQWLNDVIRESVEDEEYEALAAALKRLGYAAQLADLYGLGVAAEALSPVEEVAFEEGDAVTRALVGARVTGCGTRRLARAACEEITGRPGYKAAEQLSWIFDIGGDVAIGFLEVGAGDALLPALRRAARQPTSEEWYDATEWLLTLGDPEFPAGLLPRVMEFDAQNSEAVDGRRAPPLAGHYADLLRNAEGEAREEPAVRLATALGLPPVATSVFWSYDDGTELPDAAVEALLDDRPIDAVVEALAMHPDYVPTGLGLVRDERVAEHIRSVRDRRELGQYWSATAELALMGDPAARAEYTEALRIGRYRVVDSGGLVQRTLGLDLETVPFLISELRSNCCRVVTHGLGDVIRELFGIDCYGLARQGRITPHQVVTRIWDDADGQFVYSRIAERLLPAPR